MTMGICKVVAALGIAGLWVVPTWVQQKPKTENLWINGYVSDESLEGKHALISILADGKIVAQKETTLPFSSVLFSRVPGSYHVKLEGAGFKTLTKGPYQVIAGESCEVKATVEPGQGATVILFGDGPMSREEIATRIKRLEEAVAKLQKPGG